MRRVGEQHRFIGVQKPHWVMPTVETDPRRLAGGLFGC